MGTTTNLKLPFPELSDQADANVAVGGLATATESYFYNRTLPSGVVRAPSYFWGAGNSLPTTGVVAGDSYRHTGLGCLMSWNGSGWRQVDESIAADPAARNVISTNYSGLLHPNFRVFESSTRRTVAWDGIQWVKVAGPVEQLLTGFPLDQNIWNIGPGQTGTTLATSFTMPVAGNVRTFTSCMWGSAMNSAGFFTSYIYPQGPQRQNIPQYATGSLRIHNENTGLNEWQPGSWGGELFVPAGGQVAAAAFSADSNGYTMGATQTYMQVYF